jgi:hypothetical protein
VLSNSRGDVYRGEFVAGRREGKGVQTKGGVTYDGVWKDDLVRCRWRLRGCVLLMLMLMLTVGWRCSFTGRER